MEDPEYSEWIIQEYSSSKEDEGGSMLKWILNKGYVIGSKIAVAGVVISSAPLVVPPLVVASAMEVAASVPFWLLYAGYACTNKLMNIFLPTPPPPPPLMLEYYNADEYYQPAEIDSMVDSKLAFDDDMNHEMVLELDDVSGDGDDGCYLEVNEDVETMKAVGVEEIDSQKAESEEEKGMGTQETSKDGSEDVEEHVISSNADSMETGDDEKNTNTNINIESLEVGSEVKKSDAVAPAENVDALTPSPRKRAPLDPDNASKTYKKMPSKEENLDDEKIWEKIRAMRRLVGYKAPSHPTCMGELKALYVFTGVEPPASFEGDSDPDEVNAKLKFLMAIVGVK